MRKLLFIFFSFFLISTIFTSFVFAQELRSSERAELRRDEIINNDYFTTGEAVIISGTVNGDAYAAGGNILVDGQINGDLFAAGGNITITGEVSNDIRVTGGNITVSSPVGGNITALGGNVVITENASVSGSLVTGSGTAQVLGPIGRGITAGSGQLTIGNSVGGDLVAGVGELSITQNAALGGNVTYYSEKSASIAEGSSVLGEITHNRPKEEDRPEAKNIFVGLAGLFSFLTILDIIVSFVIGLLFLKLLPIFTKNSLEIISTHPFRSFAIGLISLIILPIISIIFIITIIGIPLGILIFISIFLLLCFGKIFSAFVIGKKITDMFNRRLSDAWTLLVGVIIVAILAWVPIIGALVLGIASLIGMGAILNSKKRSYVILKSKKLI